jgi:hypothetical protein
MRFSAIRVQLLFRFVGMILIALVALSALGHGIDILREDDLADSAGVGLISETRTPHPTQTPRPTATAVPTATKVSLLKAGPLDVRVIAAAERNSGTDFDIKLPEESRSYVLVSLSITNPSNISERLDSDGFRLVVDGIRVPVDNSATAMVSDNFGQQKMGNILGSWVDPGETRSFLLVFQPSKYARRHAIEISRSD